VSDPQATGSQAGGPGSRDWDAGTYDRISDPQLRWATEQFERLRLAGDEVVLDAGCGSGRVTALLADLVPRGRLYAVDVAPSMVEHARERLGSRATVLRQDLTELELPEPVDAIFSNATFHWLPDHARLFASLRGALREGGRLVAQCGGRGNIDAFRRRADEVAFAEPFARYFGGWHGPWTYAGPEETAERLRAAGFVDVETWLEPRDTPLADPRPFVRTVCLVRHLDRLPERLHDPFVDAVLERYGSGTDAPGAVPFVLHYVRLNMVASAGPVPLAR
jgi:trans-aconitate 2-methyltransferase